MTAASKLGLLTKCTEGSNGTSSGGTELGALRIKEVPKTSQLGHSHHLPMLLCAKHTIRHATMLIWSTLRASSAKLHFTGQRTGNLPIMA